MMDKNFYNAKIIKRNNATIKLQEKHATKIIKVDQGGWEEEYYNLYVLFSKDHSYVVKPIEWKTRDIYEMERLDIVCDGYDVLDEGDEYDKLHKMSTLENALKIVKLYSQIYLDCLEFSEKHLPKGQYFFHDDVNLSNIVFTSDGQIKLIDADSFRVDNNFLNISHKSYSQAGLLKAHLLSELLKQNENV